MARERFPLLIGVLYALVAPACSLLAGGAPECDVESDCPAAQRCFASSCVALPRDGGDASSIDGGSDARDAGGPQGDAGVPPDDEDAGPPPPNDAGQPPALDAGGPQGDDGGPPNDEDAGEASGRDGGTDAGETNDLDAGPVESCGNSVLDPGEECDSTSGCSPACSYGTVVCVDDDAAYCYRELPYLAHGFAPLAPPVTTDPDPYFHDLTLDCVAAYSTATVLLTLCNEPVTATAGTDVLIFHVGNLMVTGKINFTGPRRVVFAVYGDVRIEEAASLHVDASATTSGSGAGDCAGGAGEGGNEAAGAGGSHGSVGGPGGSDPDDEGGSPNPVTTPDGHALLRGGCKGGSGSSVSGGGAGGALQISAGGRIDVEGRVSANGAGGRAATDNDGASGGGSGGDVFLQAAWVQVGELGAVVAQGGGGGGGGGGGHGGDGSPDPTSVAAGGTAGSEGAAGGAGAGGASTGLLVAAKEGVSPSNGGEGGGGGGGGGGRIGIDLYDVDACESLARERMSPQPDCR